jgi:hypothetical protein
MPPRSPVTRVDQSGFLDLPNNKGGRDAQSSLKASRKQKSLNDVGVVGFTMSRERSLSDGSEVSTFHRV